MGKGIVKLGEGQWAVKDGNLLAAKETNGRFKNTEFTVSRGTRATYVGRDGLIKESNLQDVNLVNNGDFSELGSELVTNGAFDTDSDWSTTSTWDIVNNQAEAIGNGISQYIQQDFSITNGNVYKFSYEIIENTLNGNGASLSSSGGFGSVSLSNVVGTHTEYITASNDAATYVLKIGVSGTATSGAIKIDNISVKEVDPNDYWTAQNGWTLQDGLVSFGGTVSSYRKLFQENFLTIGNTYKLSFEILSISSGSIANLEASSPSFDTVGVKTQTFVATYDDLYLEPTNDANLTITNISVQEIKTDTPRIDFTDNTDGHLLLEPQSTNLITYSEDFEDSSWSNASVGTTPTLEGGYTAPDGSNNAYKISNANQDSFWYSSSVIGADNSRTIWARTVSGTGTAQLTSHNSNTNNTFNLTETWQRFEVNGTTSGIGSTNFYAVDFRGSGTLTELLIWGAQAEALSHSTSYIPTNGSTVTRDAETCTGAGSSADFNSEEGVLYAEIAALENDGTNRRISISDGSDTNRLNLFYTQTTNEIKANYRVSNSTIVTIDTTDFNITNFNKIAFRWQSGNFVLFINGENKGTNSNTTMILANTLNVLRFEDPNLVNEFYGKCKAIKVYKEALSDTDLENLTS